MAAVINEDSAAFGALMRRYRRRADMTQEELAERSFLSVRTIRNLELALVRRPRRDTVSHIVTALGLDEADTETLRSTVRCSTRAVFGVKANGHHRANDPLAIHSSMSSDLADLLANVAPEWTGRSVMLVLCCRHTAKPD